MSLGSGSAPANLLEGTIHARLLYDPEYFHRLAQWNRDLFRLCDGLDRVIMDYGSGFGFTVFFMAAFGAAKAIGIEIDQKRVSLASSIKDAYFQNLNIEFRCKDGLNNPGEQLDAVLFQNVLSHVKLPIKTLVEATEALCYSGRLVIEDNNKHVPTCYLNLGWVDERMLNPHVYAKVLEDLGFECIELGSTWFNRPAWITKVWSVLARSVPQMLLRLFPAFRLTGEKRRM